MWWHKPIIPVLRRQEQEEHHEFKANLSYREFLSEKTREEGGREGLSQAEEPEEMGKRKRGWEGREAAMQPRLSSNSRPLGLGLLLLT